MSAAGPPRPIRPSGADGRDRDGASANGGGSAERGDAAGSAERARPSKPIPVREAAAGLGAAERAPGTAGPATGERGALQIAEVVFKGLRSDCYAFRHVVPLRNREYVVVEADRGQDMGSVKLAVDAASHTCGGGCDAVGDRPVPPPSKRVLRRAAPADVQRLHELRGQEMEVRRRTRELVDRHGLPMKVSDAEWQWDRNKLTVYFTAEKRVDFRALVRDMARAFRTRIELRQIGVRDEARRVGGLGRCRRELCCRSWLREMEPVTLQLAKDQDLSLNPSQISGACGRLMNCLRYEHEFYLQARKRFPPVGRALRTERGEEKVTGWNIFKETVSLRDVRGESRTVPLEALKAETARARDGGAPESRGG